MIGGMVIRFEEGIGCENTRFHHRWSHTGRESVDVDADPAIDQMRVTAGQFRVDSISHR